MPTGNKNPRRMSRMGKMRILKTLAVMAVMLCVAAVPAMAQSELDQSQTNISSRWDMQDPDKQTFTAQKSGTLDRVELHASCINMCHYDYFNGFPTGMWVEINGTGVTDGLGDPPHGVDVLLPGSTWYSMPISPTPFVRAGNQYEIEVSLLYGSAFGAQLSGAPSDVYPGGEFSTWDGTNWVTYDFFKDLAFQTYVTPDTTAPKVDVVNPPEDPAQGTEGVARNTDVTATFSERMDPDTLSTSTFKLFKVNKNGTTSRITPAPVNLSEDGLTATLNPFGSSDTRLNKSTKYKAVVTTGAKDLAGNALDQDATKLGNQQKVWYFTTGTT
jgi:Bacterial Ig-like domain